MDIASLPEHSQRKLIWPGALQYAKRELSEDGVGASDLAIAIAEKAMARLFAGGFNSLSEAADILSAETRAIVHG